GHPDHLSCHPSHGRRLFLLRGHADQRARGHGFLPRPQDHRRRCLHRRKRSREFRASPALPSSTIGTGEIMDIGVVLQTDPPASWVIERARQAEQAGFSHVWTYDSCVLWQEPFVIYANILSGTSHIQVGPMVTNPATRDVSVTASIFATLNDMFGNRTVCGIGRGDSALRVIGRKPTSMQTFADAITAIKELAEGREAIFNGVTVKLPWASDSRLPVWGAGYGPKALQVIGERADGLILQVADPDIARWTIDSVRAAARSAGRDPDELTICVAAPA